MDASQSRSSGPFDPYERWLQIPLGRRPPSPYELLGLPDGERDVARIRAAAEARYHTVRAYEAAPDDELSEHAHRLLTEISRAVIALTQQPSFSAPDAAGDQTTRADSSAASATVSEEGEIPPVVPLAGQPEDSDQTAVRAAVKREYPDGGPVLLGTAAAVQPGIASAALQRLFLRTRTAFARWRGLRPRQLMFLVLRAAWAVVRWSDKLLQTLVGKENTILHNFLRVVLPICGMFVVAVSLVLITDNVRARRAANEAVARAAAEAVRVARESRQAAVRRQPASVLSTQQAADAGPTIAVRSKGEAIPSLAGTTWAERDATDGVKTYRWEEDGTLCYSSRGRDYRNGTWKQTGAVVYFEINGKYREFTGTVKSDRIEGKSWNKAGKKWNVTMTRQTR